MHRGPQAEVVPKTLHGIFAAEECIKLQKDFPSPLFNFYKALSQRFHDLYVLKMWRNFFLNKAKISTEFSRCIELQKDLKLFNFQWMY